MTTMWLSISRRLALPALLLLLYGCSSGEVRGRISGRVTFEGKPVAEGRVVFTNNQKGIHMTAKIKADGRYEVRTAKGAGLPLATYQVFVSPPPTEAVTGVFNQKLPVKECADIPPKYRDAATSGLTLTLTEGENRLDIEMK
jgi:hypothetical protein